MTLAHACKAEKAAAMPYLNKCMEILKRKPVSDPLAVAFDAMNERERVFWMRAAGAADVAARTRGKNQSADLAPSVWEAVRAAMLKSGQRVAGILGGA